MTNQVIDTEVPKIPRRTAEELRRICLEAGADDAGFVEIGRPALDFEREEILTVYPKTKSIISILRVLNRESIQSPARSVANKEFHRAGDDLAEISQRILRSLNRVGVRGVAPTVGFPMEMDRWPGKIWPVSHKVITVEAGLGHMGINRNAIHPKYGNFILLDSILIDAELDRYGQPLENNPCVGCHLCVAACPVGAIRPDQPFDFMACMTHNYREFMGGFQDWVEKVVSSKDVLEYRSHFRDNEMISLWQSLSFGANYKSAYCMAVCPAGEDVLKGYLPNKKAYVEEVVRPLKDKPEPVYVIPDTRAESAAKKNPHKEVRPVRTPLRPRTISGFLRGIKTSFNPEKAKRLRLTIQFEFSGKEAAAATVVISDGRLEVHEGRVGRADLFIRADSETWIRIVNQEVSVLWPLLTRRLRVRGNPKHLLDFQRCVTT